jgi:hypothetical protein
MNHVRAGAVKSIKNVAGHKEIEMNECICSSCKNLKSIIEVESGPDQFECEFGFPSENCEGCEGNECNETCINYINDENEDTVIIKCKNCGKDLEKTFNDDTDGDVYCVNCYLSESN